MRQYLFKSIDKVQVFAARWLGPLTLSVSIWRRRLNPKAEFPPWDLELNHSFRGRLKEDDQLAPQDT
jgi:hypothetical protein